MTDTVIQPHTTHPAGLSKASLVSFILGLLLCIPFLTSLTAVFFAIAGFKATGKGGMRGRGFAITGLILGLVGTLAWIGSGTLFAILFVASSEPRALTHSFVRDVPTGDIPAASAVCDPSVISPAALDNLHTVVAGYGTYSDLTCWSTNISVTPAGKVCTLTGSAYFSSGTHSFSATLKNDGSRWQVYGFHIYP